MDAVVLSHLSRTFGGTVEAVIDINLECREGELLCFLGPSGCGKSTTLRMIAGLERATSGDIIIKGRRVNDVPARDRHIAMVFENYALYKFLTVYNNIAFPLRIQKTPDSEIERKVMEAARLVAIDDILHVRADSLSGGQQQRVGIARAIVRDADVLLMDEPISHLEARLRAKTRRELKHLQRSLGIATIYVTHDQLEAMALGDRIAVMNRGRLQQIGTPSEIINKPQNMFVAGFVGEPPINFIDVDLIREGDRLVVTAQDIKLELAPESGKRVLDVKPAVGGEGAGKIMGIRPFDITITRDTEHVPGKGMVGELIEWMPINESAIATARVGGAEVLVLTDVDFKGRIGESVGLLPRLDCINLFDSETTLNLLAV